MILDQWVDERLQRPLFEFLGSLNSSNQIKSNQDHLPLTFELIFFFFMNLQNTFQY